MLRLLEFIEIVRSYWESAVVFFIVAGLTWVFGHLYAVGSGSEEVPWYVSVIIFLFLFPVIGYRIWLNQKRQHEEETQNLKDEHQKQTKTFEYLLTAMKTALPTSTTERKWLSDVAEKDRMAVDMAVRVLGCKMGLHLYEDPAYISFEFQFFNASIYPIIVSVVEGHILLGKRKLEKEIIISTKWPPERVPHTYLHSIEIFQYLTKEEADIIRLDLAEPKPKDRTRAQLNLKHLRLMIDGGVDGETIVRKPMRLHRDAAITLEGKAINI